VSDNLRNLQAAAAAKHGGQRNKISYKLLEKIKIEAIGNVRTVVHNHNYIDKSSNLT
jgi:hypothetical protein